MLHRLLQFFGVACRHRHLTHPFAAVAATSARSDDWDIVTSQSGSHYVVCLDCGRKFQYDWSNMRILW